MSLHASDEGFSFCLQALLSLCSDELVSAKSALDLCINQMKKVLSSQQLPENASVETIGRAYHVTETLVQVCYLCCAPCLSGSRLFSTVVVYASCLKVLNAILLNVQFNGYGVCSFVGTANCCNKSYVARVGLTLC